MNLSIASEPDDDGLALTLSGALDLQSRTAFTEAAERAIDQVGGQAGTATLVLDLFAVDFIDSTGIGALVQVGRTSEDAGVQFVLRDPSPRVRRILEITGLLDEWTIKTTAAD